MAHGPADLGSTALVLFSLGISLAMRLIPRPVLEECRERADAMLAEGRPTNWVASGAIVAIWLLLAVLGIVLALRALS